MTDIDWQVVGRKGKISKRLGGSASKTTADRGCYPPACSFKDEAGGSIDQLKTAHKNLKLPLPGWSYCPSRDVGRLNTAGQKRLNSQTFSDAEEADSEVLRLKAKVLQAKQRVLASPFFANLLAALETTDRRPSLTHDELSYFGSDCSTAGSDDAAFENGARQQCDDGQQFDSSDSCRSPLQNDRLRWAWSSCTELVSYGLGSFQSGPGMGAVPKCQLALVLALKDHMRHLTAPPQLYDPAFTQVDRQLVTALGCHVINKNEHGRRCFTDPYPFPIHAISPAVVTHGSKPGSDASCEPQAAAITAATADAECPDGSIGLGSGKVRLSRQSDNQTDMSDEGDMSENCRDGICNPRNGAPRGFNNTKPGLLPEQEPPEQQSDSCQTTTRQIADNDGIEERSRSTQMPRQALVYLPHCKPELTESLLAANWTPRGLTSFAFIGNSMGRCAENWAIPSTRALLASPPTHLLATCAAEAVVETRLPEGQSDMPGAFNDTTFHHFTRPGVAAAPPQ